ncbi:MAG: hypothetical protein H7Y27_05455 [Gemmatimonadaceae bacterium]|nr:hypothetical protein [Chitinophagaceae bacterium]
MAKVSAYPGRKYMMTILLVCCCVCGFSQYKLSYFPVDRDTAFLATLKLQASFPNRQVCLQYIDKLPALLNTKGYPAASVDSLSFDTSSAAVSIFVGEPFKITGISTRGVEKRILDNIGFNEKQFVNKPIQPEQLQQLQEKLLDYYENNGHPFAKVKLDSFIFEEGAMKANLVVEEGRLYKFDSIRIYGTGKISNGFLQQYLDIKNGSIYQKKKLQNITQKISELPYMQEQQPWNLSMLGTGSIINLYLLPRKSSQINVLVGFLPANQTANNSYEQVRTKLLFTGEANVNLRNALGNGELIGLNWQQIQQKSPRLNLQFQQPYLWGSPFGIATSFDLFKKDSAYLNLNFQAGVQYALSINQTGKIFIQTLRTNLLTVDTLVLKSEKRLPNEIDLGSVSLGVDYEINKTDYRLNPRKGFELALSASAGTRKIRKNNVIQKLYDPNFNFSTLYDTVQLKTYQFRIKAIGAKYFRVTKQSTVKTAFNGGWLQSPSIFRNELFQIGGYKLLRGFDEESIFASQYAVGTAEYRYIIGRNSFFFAFADLGWATNKSVRVNTNNTFIGAGLGLAFETRAGVFNISYAAGKRDDVKFDLRQSKIHLGYVNYF